MTLEPPHKRQKQQIRESVGGDSGNGVKTSVYPHERRKEHTAYRGTLVHSLSLGRIEMILDGIIVVGVDGCIESVQDLSTQSGQKFLETLETPLIDHRGKLIMPGFVDGHAHAPQYAFTGTGMDLPLLQWLETYTFPCEAKFKDPEFARDVYLKAVDRHLRYGTTTCSYFATIHLEACKVLVDVVKRLGQRAYVGKVSMDRNSPDYLIETTPDAIRDAEAFAKFVMAAESRSHGVQREGSRGKETLDIKSANDISKKEKQCPLVTPVLTPRFVPSCTSELMKALGDLSEKYLLPVQTHLSESQGEIAWVRELHPECDSYMGVYERYGLLHERSYFAHCVHCNGSERALMRVKGGGVVHCPSSNFMLSSGVCNVKQFLKEGNKVGLGTDVAGGYSASILDCLRQAMVASKVCSFGFGLKEGEAICDPLTFQEAFHLATQGGAETLGLGDHLGNFLVGKNFDALIVDPTPEAGRAPAYHMFSDLNQGMQQAFEKFLFLGDDRNISQVFVGGVRVI